MTTVHLPSPQGPHDPDSTIQGADTIAEAVRLLAYATRDGAGLTYPSHAYDVLARLRLAAGGLPQSLQQMDGWLQGEARAGRAVEHFGGPHGGDTAAALRATSASLASAQAAAEELRRHLAAAQEHLSGMEGR